MNSSGSVPPGRACVCELSGESVNGRDAGLKGPVRAWGPGRPAAACVPPHLHALACSNPPRHRRATHNPLGSPGASGNDLPLRQSLNYPCFLGMFWKVLEGEGRDSGTASRGRVCKTLHAPLICLHNAFITAVMLL